jgi:hypothetical protein
VGTITSKLQQLWEDGLVANNRGKFTEAMVSPTMRAIAPIKVHRTAAGILALEAVGEAEVQEDD